MEKNLLLATMLSLALIGCTGEGGSDKKDSQNTQNQQTKNQDNSNAQNKGNNQQNAQQQTQSEQIGYFIDAPVSNVEYETSSGLSGKTDSEGKFIYKTKIK